VGTKIVAKIWQNLATWPIMKKVEALVPHSQSSLTFLTQVVEIFSYIMHTILHYK
jgi:hypothetical protein